MSEEFGKKNIAGKLVQVMKACGYVQKDSENKEQKYKYVSAAAVLEKVNPALVEARLISIPQFIIVSEREKPTARGGVWQLVNVQCTLKIIDADSSEWVTVTSLGTGTDPGDKATAKAQTMALKYAWLTALNIETGDEPSADERTDQQAFITSVQVLPAGIPDTPHFRHLCSLWEQVGWGINTLAGYLEQRFGKPVGEINFAEVEIVIAEANQYVQTRR